MGDRIALVPRDITKQTEFHSIIVAKGVHDDFATLKQILEAALPVVHTSPARSG
jgi:hypothetical protein